MGRLIRYIFVGVLFGLVLVGVVQAGSHSDAVTTADLINKAIKSQTLPYERELTMTQLEQLGYDTPNMTRPGTYKIRIKSVSYDASRGIVSVNMWAWHNGTQLKTHSPWHFYMPMTISGSNNAQRLSVFVTILISNLELLPYGTPVGDDSYTIYPTVDGMASEGSNQTWTTSRGDVGDTIETSGTTTYFGYLRSAAAGSGYFVSFGRGIASYNISTATNISGATIDTAILKTTYSAKDNDFGTPEFGITGGTLGTNTTIVAGDYNEFASTEFCSRKAYADLSGTVNFTLNDQGKWYIQNRTTSFAVFFYRDGWDLDNSFGGVWVANSFSYYRYYSVDYGTEASRPFLYLEYTPAAGCSAPVAAFSGNVTSGYPSFPVLFTDASTNTPTDWDWYFGDETKDSDSQNPTWTVNNVIGNTPTSYDIKLYAANACGGDWENKTSYITAYPLLANFSMNVSSGCAPLTIGFTDTTGNGTPTTWDWDFGGDGSAATQNPSHTFNTPGTYYIQLNASNSYSWDIENKTASVTVSPGAPTADFTQNTTWGYPDFPVLFNDTSTGSPSAWDWYFPNGGDAHTQNATWTFDYVIGDTATAYNVSLNASNTCGYSWKNQTFLIWEYPLLTNFSADTYTGCAPLTVTFTDTTGNGTPIAWNWSFGTGDYNATQNPTYTYNTPGVYDVILNASNLYSFGIETKLALINVSNCAGVPVAAFSANVTTGCPTLNVLFTDASTGNISSWSWDVNNDGIEDYATQNCTASYGIPGTYSVNLTVTGAGGSDSEVKINYITVSDDTVAADFSADDTTPTTSQTVTFTDLSTGGPDTWYWDFENDGVVDSNDQNPTHVFAVAGIYTVNLTATNPCGGNDTEIKVDYITVVNATPTPTPTPVPPSTTLASEGGVSPFGISVMMLMTTGLFIYSFADNENRNYLHIFGAGVGMVMAFAIGSMFIVGMVVSDQVVLESEQIVNNSTIGTHGVEHIAMHDGAVGWFWIFVGVVLLLFTVLATFEVLQETREGVR